MKRIIASLSSTLALCAALAACGQPVPPEKSAYVGEWRQKDMYLLITNDGNVRYRRFAPGANVSIDAPLKGFTDKGFEVGIGPASTTFVVGKKPYQDGAVWKMEVDGVLLSKTDEIKPQSATQ